MLVELDGLKKIIEAFPPEDYVSFDVENQQDGKLYMLSMAWRYRSNIVRTCMMWKEEYKERFQEVVDGLKLVTHYGKHDVGVMRDAGVWVEPVRDTWVMARLSGDRRGGLKQLSESELGEVMVHLKDIAPDFDLTQVPADQLVEYSEADAVQTIKLEKVLWDKMGSSSRLVEVETKVMILSMEMQRIGIAVDQERIDEVVGVCEKEIAGIEELAQMMAPGILLTSTMNCSGWLFEKFGVSSEGIPKGKLGYYSTANQYLEPIREAHPLIALILAHRSYSKMLGTYLYNLKGWAERNPDHRIHANFDQFGAVHGRFSSSGQMNMQQIPTRTELGRRVRETFVSRPGWKLVSIDYSQIELRALAALTGIEVLVHAFENDLDVHMMVAAVAFGCRPELVSKDMRYAAKAINFGCVYGKGAASFLAYTGGDWGLAHQMYEKVFPGMEEALWKIRGASYRGSVTTWFGRRVPVPLISKESDTWHKKESWKLAVNYATSGTASDIMKIGMGNFFDIRQDIQAELLLQIHDELVLEIPEDRLEIEIPIIAKCLLNVQFPIPLKVDVEVGDRWGQLDHYDWERLDA